MDRDERNELRTITDEVAGWVDQARSVLRHRAKVDKAADDALGALRRAVVDARRDGTVAWRAMLLRPDEGKLLGAVARQVHQPSLAPSESQALDRLAAEVPTALHDVKAAIGARRLFSGNKKRDVGQAAAQFLVEFRGWGLSTGLPQLLHRLDRQDESATEVSAADALADWVGLGVRVTDLGRAPEVLASATVAELPDAIKTIEKALKDEARFRSDALSAGEAVRKSEARKLLTEMPVDRLKEATRDRLRIGPLTDAGIATVQAVLDRGAHLEHLPGIGATTATRMRGAAQTLWQTTYDEMPVRIDIKDHNA